MFEVKKTSSGRKAKRPDFETLGKLYLKYIAGEYTSADIAEMYGVRPATVRTWFMNERRKEEAAKEREMNG